ncbi:MAG: nucleotide-binding protein [Candidatus Odinarchaeia archaeon]
MIRTPTTKVIGVTGGKGGTGKTVTAINIAAYAALDNKKVLLVDCDVDSPNVHLLLGGSLTCSEKVFSFYPIFLENKCIKCGKCSEVCREHAILQPPGKIPLLFPELCNGCKACLLVCPVDAIAEGKKEVGETLEGSNYGIDFVTGRLKVGETKSTLVVSEAKKRASRKNSKNPYDLIIIDTAPGAHCDVVNALFGVNLAIAVTEPTPFGLSDLQRILKLIEGIGIDVHIVLNRSDLGGIDTVKRVFKDVPKFYQEIPYDDAVLESYVRGIPVSHYAPNSHGAKAFKELYFKLKGELGF